MSGTPVEEGNHRIPAYESIGGEGVDAQLVVGHLLAREINQCPDSVQGVRHPLGPLHFVLNRHVPPFAATPSQLSAPDVN